VLALPATTIRAARVACFASASDGYILRRSSESRTQHRDFPPQEGDPGAVTLEVCQRDSHALICAFISHARKGPTNRGIEHHERRRRSHPEEVSSLVTQSLIEHSVDTQVSTVIRTNSHSLRVPIVTTDGVDCRRRRDRRQRHHARRGRHHAEEARRPDRGHQRAADSATTLTMIGDGLVRDLCRKLDAAYFGNTGVCHEYYWAHKYDWNAPTTLFY
jgi:hypothetical protein